MLLPGAALVVARLWFTLSVHAMSSCGTCAGRAFSRCFALFYCMSLDDHQIKKMPTRDPDYAHIIPENTVSKSRDPVAFWSCSSDLFFALRKAGNSLHLLLAESC